MKTIRVVAALILDCLDCPARVYATARGYGPQKGGWEFPGGKLEPGETPEEALVREIREELDILVRVGKLLRRVEYDYPEFHLSMDCFCCVIAEGTPTLREAMDARWLDKAHLDTVPWLPADRVLLDDLTRLLHTQKTEG